MPLLIAVGPDGKSFRVFKSRIDGKDAEFFLKGETEGETQSVAKSDQPAATEPANPPNSKPTETKTAEAKPAEAQTAETKPVGAKPASPAAKGAPATAPWILLDTTTASEWNFQGCAISGPAQGKCLDRIPALKDYWFNWRNYHPNTSIYKR